MMYSWLTEAIAANVEVITASRRLARELRAVYDEHQVTKGHAAWLTPAILSWHDWLSRCASSVASPESVAKRLDPVSAAALLEGSLRQHLPDGIPGIGGLVRQAGQAWQRLNEWRIPVSELEASARSLDERAFSDAVQDYQRRLSTEGWIDSAGMMDLVAGLIAGDQIAVPKKILLAGFDRLSPAVDNIVSALETAGCEVSTADPASRSTDVNIQAFDSAEAELRAAGRWARTRLDDNPDARLAIVSPVLESGASDITRLVREGLVPGWQYGDGAFAAAANVSYGRKLADYPAIAIALLLLRWACYGLNSRELSLLLRSRCIGGHEVDGRSRIELALRRYPDRLWSAVEFLQLLSVQDDSPDMLSFRSCAGEVQELASRRGETESPAEWARNIDAVMQASGWPGIAALDSSEFQLVNRWRELLNEFARIEMVLPRISLADTYQRLASLAADTIYQPDSGQGLVHVMGVLEAAGMEFDGVWISGMDASQWPPHSRPAAFISTGLQRRYAMPDATAGDTLVFATRVLERLVGSAASCVVSWSRFRDDSELTASSLLDRLAASHDASGADPGWYAGALVGNGPFESVPDDSAPPVRNGEKVRGGAYTVQRQYMEPFGAFVYGRLGVRTPDPIATGLSPGARGNIIHAALHILFAGKPGQADIGHWTEESVDQRVGSAIDSALAEHVSVAGPVIRRVLALERGRLRSLLKDFIGAELERPAFTVVDVEKAVDYEAFGVRLGLRIDRIDRLANGRLLLIDYKTGAPKHFLDRNDEPTDLQLLVYADATDADIGGLALINVDSREISFKAAGGEGGPWKPVEDQEWQDKLGGWRTLVHKAMQELSAGDVRISILRGVAEDRTLNMLSRKEELKRAD